MRRAGDFRLSFGWDVGKGARAKGCPDTLRHSPQSKARAWIPIFLPTPPCQGRGMVSMSIQSRQRTS
eukprot:scaffold33083_cov129-Isochrysis_galbana.AAC.6